MADRLQQNALLDCIGFTPHEVHDTGSLFGWILPTFRTSEFTVLQLVGLDAAVVSVACTYTSPTA